MNTDENLVIIRIKNKDGSESEAFYYKPQELIFTGAITAEWARSIGWEWYERGSEEE